MDKKRREENIKRNNRNSEKCNNAEKFGKILSGGEWSGFRFWKYAFGCRSAQLRPAFQAKVKDLNAEEAGIKESILRAKLLVQSFCKSQCLVLIMRKKRVS